MGDVLPKPVQPQEAIAWFEAKGYRVGFDWRDSWQQQHAAAFTVAKAMSLDILQDIRAEVERALSEGTTLRDFQKRLEPVLDDKGWWGRRPTTDTTTGETGPAQLGSPRRLRTIFDTNLRSAYAAGRWAQIQRVKERRPYLRYVSILDGRTRRLHREWHGIVLPVDHPWWHTNYPPNGWHCRCSVQQLSERDLVRYGYKVSQAPGGGSREWVNGRTGESVEVPAGIDPGFGFNVGMAAHPPVDPAKFTMPELGHEAARLSVRAQHFRDLAEGRIEGAAPVGYLDDTLAATIGAGVRRVDVSSDTLKKQREHHPELQLEEYQVVPEMFRTGLVIRDGEQALVFFKQAGRTYKAAVKATKEGNALFLTSFHRASEKTIAGVRRRGQVVRDWQEGK